MFDLYNIKDPSFLKTLSVKELNILASEIREFLINNLSETGGHLSSNLGVIELTIALHYCFNDIDDKFIFDVSHQIYTHKILTGRAREFSTLRQTDGLSGYASYKESAYDVWESGHSSTSISALAGFMMAKEYDKPIKNVVAIIGDSSISSGIAFEALNDLGQNQKSHPIIVLNDNNRSIGECVGSLNNVFGLMRSNKILRRSKKIIRKIFPAFINNFFHSTLNALKSFVQADNIFETLGYDYFGPVDGNDISELIKVFKRLSKVSAPCVVHVITKKGKGYKFSEEDKTGKYHSVAPFDIASGEFLTKKNKDSITFSQVVVNTLLDIRKERKFMVINPAMSLGTKMDLFINLYPSDYKDVGIAEEHGAILASSISKNGCDVVLLYYSTFAQRAYDQILNDIARPNIKVIIGLDRAGIVGEDGSTHQGIYDVSMFMHMPNIKICMPRNDVETHELFMYAFNQDNPIVIRYPKDSIKKSNLPIKQITDVSWDILKEGSKLIIISYGNDLDKILDVVNDNNIDAYVVNARFIKPFDTTMLKMLINLNLPIIVYEQVVEYGNLSSAILQYAFKHDLKINKFKTISLHVNDVVLHGKKEEIIDKYNIGYNKILQTINDILGE